jgi:glycosyltransferase involved in cell wall biosynthesis
VKSRERIAVVSPFIDKRHGTERCIAEQVERLARSYEIHVYSNRVEDVDLKRIVCHRVPRLPGPLLTAYCWWVIANHFSRWWDACFRKLAPVMVYSPGINCFDADLISVHIVFAEYLCRLGNALAFRANAVRVWPRLLHRRIYYRLLVALERVIYGGKKATLVPISGRVARELQMNELPVITHGIDAQRFNPGTRARLRDSARRELGVNRDDFCVLLVGNDWKNKGLDCLLQALARLRTQARLNPKVDVRTRLLVAGEDSAEPYRPAIIRLGLTDRVTFLPPRADVEFYYAAADLYAGPSLEDAFGLPPLEAMACGAPAIVSSQAGVSELISDGVDGLVLDDPRDSAKLAGLIALLCRDAELRARMGEAAARTAGQHTWDRNAEQLSRFIEEVIRRKRARDHARESTNHEGKEKEKEKEKAAPSFGGVC